MFAITKSVRPNLKKKPRQQNCTTASIYNSFDRSREISFLPPHLVKKKPMRNIEKIHKETCAVGVVPSLQEASPQRQLLRLCFGVIRKQRGIPLSDNLSTKKNSKILDWLTRFYFSATTTLILTKL